MISVFFIKQIFDGNSDQNTEVTNFFPDEVLSRYIRVYVASSHDTPTLRFDLLGCYDETAGNYNATMIGIISAQRLHTHI